MYSYITGLTYNCEGIRNKFERSFGRETFGKMALRKSKRALLLFFTVSPCIYNIKIFKSIINPSWLCSSICIFNIGNFDKEINKELPEDDLIEDRNMLESFLKCFK